MLQITLAARCNTCLLALFHNFGMLCANAFRYILPVTDPNSPGVSPSKKKDDENNGTPRSNATDTFEAEEEKPTKSMAPPTSGYNYIADTFSDLVQSNVLRGTERAA